VDTSCLGARPHSQGGTGGYTLPGMVPLPQPLLEVVRLEVRLARVNVPLGLVLVELSVRGVGVWVASQGVGKLPERLRTENATQQSRAGGTRAQPSAQCTQAMGVATTAYAHGDGQRASERVMALDA
jgi:hypothetical protein